jgi:hypothetical protein
MFIVIQLPFADYRPLIAGEKGRLSRPDWSDDNLKRGFVQGFGKISPRNASNLGLGGERYFADMNNAVRFIERIDFRQEDWKLPLRIMPWFRRLYFDGQMAGRFELGLLADDALEDVIFDKLNKSPLDVSRLAHKILSTRVQVNSVDGSEKRVALINCAQPLASAYVAATTKNAARNQFPVADTIGREVFVAEPMLHVRISAARRIQSSRDRRTLSNANEPELFITSAYGSDIRHNVLVQASKQRIQEESASERQTRVLFAHLNALLFATSQLVKTGSSLVGANKRAVLRGAIQRMIERFGQFQPRNNDEVDEEFAAGMRQFASAYVGRIEELTGKLEALSEEWNQPSAVERFLGYVKGIQDIIIAKTVETVVKSTIKGGQ